MKTGTVTGLFVTFTICLFLGSCEAPDDREDTLWITAVEAGGTVMDGLECRFEVTVRYVLASEADGELSIGFNSAAPGSYSMIDAATAGVTRSEGSHSFSVDVVPRSWLPENAFRVYVSLSSGSQERFVLASDTQEISLLMP